MKEFAANLNENIWNIEWLKEDIKKIFQKNRCIDEVEISNLPKCIEYKEFGSFGRYE